jgi:hypothetical protein
VSILMWVFWVWIGLIVYGAVIGVRRGRRSVRNGNASNDSRATTRKRNGQREWAEANRQAAQRIRNM